MTIKIISLCLRCKEIPNELIWNILDYCYFTREKYIIYKNMKQYHSIIQMMQVKNYGSYWYVWSLSEHLFLRAQICQKCGNYIWISGAYIHINIQCNCLT